MAKRKVAEKIELPTRYEFETFRPFSAWQRSSLESPAASCFNGHIQIRKWRITAEVIEEPDDVLIERLHALWRNCDNWHHVAPMREVGKSLGIELSSDDFGIDLKKSA